MREINLCPLCKRYSKDLICTTNDFFLFVTFKVNKAVEKWSFENHIRSFVSVIFISVIIAGGQRMRGRIYETSDRLLDENCVDFSTAVTQMKR